MDHLNEDQLVEWAVETHGLRLAQTFGRLKHMKPNRDRTQVDYHSLVDTDVNWMAFLASSQDLLSQRILDLLSTSDTLCKDDFLAMIEEFNTPYSKRGKPPRVQKKPVSYFNLYNHNQATTYQTHIDR